MLFAHRRAIPARVALRGRGQRSGDARRVGAILVAIAMLASWLPVPRRAARVDPPTRCGRNELEEAVA